MTERSKGIFDNIGLALTLSLGVTFATSTVAIASKKPDFRDSAARICESIEKRAEQKEHEPSQDPVAISIWGELEIGRRMATYFETEYEVASSKRLEEIGARVARHSDRSLKFKFRAVRIPKTFNAFSIFGFNISNNSCPIDPQADNRVHLSTKHTRTFNTSIIPCFCNEYSPNHHHSSSKRES